MRTNVFGCDRLCLLLRIDHADGRTAVDGQRLAVDEVVRLVAQEEAGAGNVLRGADAPRGVELVILGAQLLLLADVDPSRGNGVDRDVQRRQRDGQRMGQRVDAALRGGVGLGAGLALQVACRAEVDNAAVAVVAVLLAVEGQPARGDEGRAQVGGQNAVKLLDREFGEGFEEADPDVVDQDVDVALCSEELLHARFEALGVGDVHLAEAGTGLGGGLRAESGVNVAEGDLVAPAGEGFDDRPADSVGTARNKYASFHRFGFFTKIMQRSPSRQIRRGGFSEEECGTCLLMPFGSSSFGWLWMGPDGLGVC